MNKLGQDEERIRAAVAACIDVLGSHHLTAHEMGSAAVTLCNRVCQHMVRCSLPNSRERNRQIVSDILGRLWAEYTDATLPVM